PIVTPFPASPRRSLTKRCVAARATQRAVLRWGLTAASDVPTQRFAGARKIREAGQAALAEPLLEGQEVTSRRRQADSSVVLHSPCGRESGELASNGRSEGSNGRYRKEELNMKRDDRSRLRSRFFVSVAMALVSGASLALVALASVPLIKISDDTYTNPTSQHKTQVEPDSFSSGNTIVATFQSGRFFDGGASNIA